ncbi:hypothetical protein NL676_001511 [Syzygium grande]|nr:hypothetical protein NL676_001511 [Syzygium grande]
MPLKKNAMHRLSPFLNDLDVLLLLSACSHVQSKMCSYAFGGRSPAASVGDAIVDACGRDDLQAFAEMK